MPYVYKYVNKNTEDVEYVGMIKKDSNFPRRFDQHKRDSWWDFGKYDIFYFYVESQTDAEALEGHFIAEYGSTEYNNIAKSGWGICSFAPTVSWLKFEDSADLSLRKGQGALDDRWKLARDMAGSLEAEAKELEKKATYILSEISRIRKDTERLRRASIRQWFRTTLEIVYYPHKGKYAEVEMLYKMYCDYVNKLAEKENQPYTDFLNFDDIYKFDDIHEFWEVMLDIKEFAPCIRGDAMYSILTKEEYDETICIPEGLKALQGLWEDE